MRRIYSNQTRLWKLLRRKVGNRGSEASPMAGLCRLVAGAQVLLWLFTAAGCTHLPNSRQNAEAKSILQPTDRGGVLTPTALQGNVMRFADEFTTVVAQAVDEFAAKVGTLEARQIATRIKLGSGTAAVIDATGPNPLVNALDLVVLASVSRMVAEDYLVGEKFGEAAIPLLQTSRKLETNAWSLVMPLLKPEQQQELRDLIQEWRAKHPNQRYVGAVRLREFAEDIGKMPQQASVKPTSVFSLLFLDPMAGLDPTVRAVEEARYLAERALYYGQRMPNLLGWQVEFLALQLADQPAARQILTNANQLTASMEIFAKTAEQLPQLVNQQREAAIQQLLAGVATERSNILASLASEEKKMRDLLAETRTTLNAGNQMAASVNGAIQSLDSFVRYVSPPKTNAAAGSGITNTNNPPFNILDYGTAAGQIGGMAKDVNALLTSVNQSVPQAAELGQQTKSNVEEVMKRAFWLGLLLILVLLVGLVLAGVAYKVTVSKLMHPERAPKSPQP